MFCARPFGGFSSNIICEVCMSETCSKTEKTRVYIYGAMCAMQFFFQIISAIGHLWGKRSPRDGVF